MAFTISDAGNGVSASSSSSLSTGATINADVGDWLLAIIGADNGGTGGASAITGINATGGNSWTQRAIINQSGGSANDGATLGVFTCTVTSALVGATVTATFSPNITAKAMQVYRIQPGAGETIELAAVDTTGATGTSGVNAYSIGPVSVTNGDTIFGMLANEAQSASGDSDTTNGNWSTLINRNSGGTGASAQHSASQYKTVNATGNQTWNGTFSSGSDWAATYIIFHPGAQAAGSLLLPSNPFMQALLVR